MTKAVPVSSSVAGSASVILSTTGARNWYDVPKSPVSALPQYCVNCCHSGRSSPNSRRIAAICSVDT